MKKTVLLFAIALIGIGAKVNAQEYWKFGVKGGVNFTNMTSDGFDDTNSRTGFNLGLLAEIPAGDHFSVQPEVLYATQGTEATRTVAGNTYTGEYQLDYIQVPVLAKFYPVQGFAIEVGPSFDFLVNEKYDYSGTILNSETETDMASSFEFAGTAGLSYKFNNGFFLDGRYFQGFTDAFDSSNWDGDAVKNNGFQLGVGFEF